MLESMDGNKPMDSFEPPDIHVDGRAVVGAERGALILDCSVPTVFRLLRAGRLEHVRLGRRTYLVLESVRELAAERKGHCQRGRARSK